MAVNKVGFGSLVIGLLIVLGMWYFVFYPQAPANVVQTIVNAIIITVEGGVVLFGLLLFVLGILMLII
jgi:hypothetical protein